MQESSYTSPKIIFLVVGLHSLLRSWNQGQISTQQPQKNILISTNISTKNCDILLYGRTWEPLVRI